MKREAPNRNEKGEIECPNEDGVLRDGKAPFYFKNQLIGNFDALVCSKCEYYALTSSGYTEAMKEAEKLGLVGPPESSETEIYEKQKDIVGLYVNRLQYLISESRYQTVTLKIDTPFKISTGSYQEQESLVIPIDSQTYTSFIFTPHRRLKYERITA